MSERGKFISLEGGDGVGKSTQLAAIAEALRARGVDVVVTREPGGSEGAERIRSLLLDPKEHWSAKTEALLFAAARTDHVERTIKPALEAGKWVISDRFLDSSLAYQGGAGKLGVDEVRDLNRFGIDDVLPDRTFVLLFGPGSNDVLERAKAQQALERAQARDGEESDRIGGRSLDFHYEVHLAFQHIAMDEPDRVRLVNASGTPEEITAILIRDLKDLLP